MTTSISSSVPDYSTPLLPTPKAGPTGAAPQRAAPQLSRYRMRTERPGLHLRTGEILLGTPYEPTSLNMVVVVRCEADGHSPGALLPLAELEDLGPAGEALGPFSWGRPGVRA